MAIQSGGKARQPLWLLMELAVSLLLVAAIHWISNRVQAPLSANNGQGWDGVWYCQMAGQFANSQTPSAMAPFVYRVGVPFLSSLVDPGDCVHGFRIVNVVASYIGTALLVIWFRLTIHSLFLRGLFLLLFLANWLAPVRLVHIYPVHVDMWTYPIVLAVLILTDTLSRRHSPLLVAAISVLCAIGIAFRETVGLVSAAIPFVCNPYPIRKTSTGAVAPTPWSYGRLWLFLPAVCASLVFFAVHRFVLPDKGGTGFLAAALMWTYSKSWLAYCHSWFIAYGPILFIPLFHFRELPAYFAERQSQAAYLFALLMITVVSPADIERHVLVAIPVIFPLTAYLLEEHGKRWRSWPVIATLLISQSLAGRWFLSISPVEGPHPAYVLLTPLSNQTPWHDLFPLFAIPRIAVTAFWEYVLLGFALLAFVRFGSLAACLRSLAASAASSLSRFRAIVAFPPDTR